MIFNGSVLQATIETVQPGAVFAADLGQGDVTYCMAIRDTELGEFNSLIAIFPGHPMLKGRPGVLNGSVIYGQKILVYPSATIVPSPNREHLVFERHRRLGAGSLAVYEDDLAIVSARQPNSNTAYSCKDGSPRSIWEASIFFRSWEIMIEGPGGEPHTLCVVSVPSD